MKVCLFLLSSLLLSVDATPAGWKPDANWKVGHVVQTTSGPVNGHAATFHNDTSVYLGIPFAWPPVGHLRFKSPEKYTGTAAINGTNFGYSCIQASNWGGGKPPNVNISSLPGFGQAVVYSLENYGVNQSEDCLTLNIWTKPQLGKRKKPVMIWIYGGGYYSGSSAFSSYDGQWFLSEHDVVIVTFNYRLNIFGFPGDPRSSQNLAFQDQRLAIEWVRDNIEAFGGDPERITLFGQSAGAGSIDFYSHIWAHDPIVTGMIMESGTTYLGAYTSNTAAGYWFSVTSTLGCEDSTTDFVTQMECVQNKTTEEIIAAIPPPEDPTQQSAYFWPTIDNDFVSPDYDKLNAAGEFAHIPLLIGNTDYEGAYQHFITTLYNGSNSPGFWDNFNYAIFDCPATARSKYSIASGIPTWRYRYFGEFPNMRLSYDPKDWRAYHSSELTLLWNAFDHTGKNYFGLGATPEEVALGKYIRGAWAAFAADPIHGLERYAPDGHAPWPKYNPDAQTLIRLGWENKSGRNLGWPREYDDVCTQLGLNLKPEAAPEVVVECMGN